MRVIIAESHGHKKTFVSAIEFMVPGIYYIYLCHNYFRKDLTHLFMNRA